MESPKPRPSLSAILERENPELPIRDATRGLAELVDRLNKLLADARRAGLIACVIGPVELANMTIPKIPFVIHLPKE